MSEIRPKDVYRGKRRLRTLVTALLLFVALLIVGAVAAFYTLESFMVYGQDGPRLEFPAPGGKTPAQEPQSGVEGGGEIELDIVYSSPDIGAVEAGEGLEPLRAVFVPADKVTSSGLEEYRQRLEAQDAGAMILEMKPDSGQLPYHTASGMAYSYGASGQEELLPALEELRLRGIYLVAQISCCVDELMATRNLPIALKTAGGAPFTENGRYWLDPYNTETRDYVAELARELASMGFDEILLANLSHPPEGEVAYSQNISGERDHVACITNFALKITQAAKDMPVPPPPVIAAGDGEDGDGEDGQREDSAQDGSAGPSETPETKPVSLRVSVLLDAFALRAGGASAQTGQDTEVFFTVFDRVYVETTAPELDGDLALAGELFTSGDIGARFVPVLYAPYGGGSWAVK